MTASSLVGLQLDLVWEGPAANHARAESWLRRGPIRAGSLVVLPEMFSSGFSMNADAVSEPPGGPTEAWARRQASELGIWLIAGLARRGPEGRPANEAIVADPSGGLAAVYRKQRPFSPGGESLHYQAGREGTMFSWGERRVAVFICYDLRFPELFRALVSRRPDLLVVIASWPDKRIAHWLALLQARAIENQAYVIGVNRVGDDPTHHYSGRSVIFDPAGVLLADAGESEGRVEAELDWAGLEAYRAKLPFLDDYRPE